MAFFDDLISGFTGQESMPQQTIIPTNDLFNQAGATLTGTIAPQTLAYNQALAPGLTDIQLGVAGLIDPSILANFRGANASILDQLNMGESLSPELTADITRELAESRNLGTDLGRSGAIYERGLIREARGQQRRQAALGAGTSGLGVSQSFFTPQSPFGPSPGITAASDLRDVQANLDNFNNLAEDIRRQNFSSLINTGGRILGTAAGAAFGAPQIGGAIGGSLFSGSSVRGVQRPQAGGGGLMSILGGMFGGGGGQFVSGTGGRPDAVTAGAVPFGGAFMGSGPY